MSRCFPLQATGSSNDALIVSIKLQEEKEKSIPDRVTEKVKSSNKKKDRKKEKSEKKKDSKDKKRHEKEKSFPGSVNQRHDDKLNTVNDFGKESKGKLSLEVLERSNLTEEHGRPAAVQNVSCSSDSTGNSGKRKRNSPPPPPPPASNIQGHGNVIRIRLSSQKRVDPSTSQGNARPLFRSDSTVSRADVMSKVREPLRTPSSSTAALKLVSPVDNNVGPLPQREEPSTSGRVESREQPPKKLSSHERKLLKKESTYYKLFQNLLPPMPNTELLALQEDEDEDDWLFGKKDEVRPPKKSRESGDDPPCSMSSVLQPRACFMSDVGVYALPFTVPF